MKNILENDFYQLRFEINIYTALTLGYETKIYSLTLGYEANPYH